MNDLEDELSEQEKSIFDGYFMEFVARWAGFLVSLCSIVTGITCILDKRVA